MLSCRHAPIVLSPEVRADLVLRYREPHRAYHTVEHIDALLRWFDTVIDEGPGWREPVDVYWAILWHDAVYDARRHDNEERSARLAHPWSARAADYVRLTAKHGSLTAADVGADPDAAHFLDADLSILGAAADVFDRYDAGVRAEYAHVPDDAYRAGRGAFLRQLAAQPRLYFTELFHARLDAAARANLQRALARLA